MFGFRQFPRRKFHGKRASRGPTSSLRFEALEQRRLLSVIVSDSFNRPDAGPSNLGTADSAYGGSGTHFYLPLFPTAGNPANPVAPTSRPTPCKTPVTASAGSN